MATWLQAQRFFAGSGDMQTGDAVLCIDGDTIGELGVGALAASPRPGDEVIEVPDGTILPGFIETHTHLHCSGSPDAYRDVMTDSLQRSMLRAGVALRTLLGAGVTTARDIGSRHEVVFPLREAVRDGIVAGPHLLLAGTPLTTTGGHFHFMGGEADDTPALLRVLREQVKAGADLIKIMATGGALTPNTNTRRAQFSEAELRAVVQEARRLERPVVAHCHATEGIRNASAAGVSQIVHCSWLAEAGGLEYDSSSVDRMVQGGIAVDPTLAVGYRAMMAAVGAGPSAAVRERHQLWTERLPYFRDMIERGVRFIVGTDSGMPNTDFGEWALTPKLLVEALGMSPLDAIAAGTSGAAAALGIDAEAGSLAVGRRADAVVVRGDPVRSIDALFDVDTVVLAGTVVKRGGRLVC